MTLTSVENLILDDPGGEVGCPILLQTEVQLAYSPGTILLQALNVLNGHLQDLSLVQFLVSLHSMAQSLSAAGTCTTQEQHIHIGGSQGLVS